MEKPRRYQKRFYKEPDGFRSEADSAYRIENQERLVSVAGNGLFEDVGKIVQKWINIASSISKPASDFANNVINSTKNAVEAGVKIKQEQIKTKREKEEYDRLKKLAESRDKPISEKDIEDFLKRYNDKKQGKGIKILAIH